MYKRLSLEETRICLIAWRERADKEALEILAFCNMGLVRHFAKRFLGQGLTFDELISAGNEGLINAINKFKL